MQFQVERTLPITKHTRSTVNAHCTIMQVSFRWWPYLTRFHFQTYHNNDFQRMPQLSGTRIRISVDVEINRLSTSTQFALWITFFQLHTHHRTNTHTTSQTPTHNAHTCNIIQWNTMKSATEQRQPHSNVLYLLRTNVNYVNAISNVPAHDYYLVIQTHSMQPHCI